MKKILVFILLVVLNQCATGQDVDEKDSLKKFSYLLISCSFHPRNILDVPNLQNIKAEEYATGFFVRQHDKLYLVTAYHVATKCDVYNGRQTDSKADLLVIRYYDTLNQIQLSYLSIAEFKKFPPVWYYKRRDLVAIDVTNVFPGANLNTVDKILYAPAKYEKFKMKSEKKFLCYGYPGNEGIKYLNEAHYVSAVKPTFYKGKLCDSSRLDRNMMALDTSHFYFSITPQQIPGTSGAPIFCYYKYRRKEWIELVGVQSGSSKFLDISIIADITKLKKEMMEESPSTK